MGGARNGGAPLDYRILGPVEVARGGQRLHMGGLRPRSVLALLLLEPNRVVSAERLINAMWGEQPPASPLATLQVHVSNLRRALVPPDAPGGASPLVTQAPGYRMEVSPSALDLLRFEDLHRRAAGAAAEGRIAEAADLYEQALAEWRGPAAADVAQELWPPDSVRWLDERRLAAQEDRFDLLLRLARHRDLVHELEAAVAESPLRERLWAQLMVALYRSGRQADALGAYGEARRTLREDLGLSPGAELRDLEAAVLGQDPRLDLRPPEDGPKPPLHGTTTMPRPADGLGSTELVLPDGHAVPLGSEPVVIGRLEGVDVVLDGHEVSRRHAEVRPTIVGHLLVDLGSTNGTLVAGRPILHHLLRDGDEVEIGSHRIRVRRVDEVGAPSR